MKSIVSFVVFLFAFSFSHAATWTGVAGTNWNNPGNWNPMGVPGAGTAVYIGAAPNYPQLQSNVSVGVIEIDPGVPIDFNGYSMTVTSGVGGYTDFEGAIFNNSNALTDIVLNINTGTGGWYTQFRGCTVNDLITFNLSGDNTFYEGGTANQFNGSVNYNVNSSLGVILSFAVASNYANNVTYTRTVAGPSYIFQNAANIGGNFSFQNNAGGLNIFGHPSITTPIGGTCNIAASYPSNNTFALRRFKNQVTGGTINVLGSTGVEIQNDTLKLTSFSVQQYKTGAYAYFNNNKLDANVTISPDASYTGGYYTEYNNNVINGNTTINVNGSNTYYESNIGSTLNVFNGTTTYNINSGASLSLSHSNSTTYNGPLTINRNVAGYTKVFGSGANVSGNFSYTNLTSGDNDIGTTSFSTLIGGTLNLNLNLSPVAQINMFKITNQTAGGKINIYNSQGFNLSNDTLKVDSLNVIGYRGSAYSYFTNNKLDGHLTLSDSATYGGGYYTLVRNNTINGTTNYKIYGSNSFYDADVADASNYYNGNTIINALSGANVYISHGDTSHFNGNLNFNRSSPGYTRAFNAGATITGNLVFNHTSSGTTEIGNVNSASTINGTLNMNLNFSSISSMFLHRIVNLTSGGKVNLKNTIGFDIQSDTLRVDSLNVIGYRGNGYAYFYNNKLIGNLTLSDSASYTGGYYTLVRNSTINGTTNYKIFGSNSFYDADVAASSNIYNGSTFINSMSGANVYISHGDTSYFNGNLTFNRSGNGYTRAFNAGVSIAGNLFFNHTASGTTEIGNLNSTSLINGTLNMNLNFTSISALMLHRVKNLTAGGKVKINNSLGFNVQSDSLRVDSLNIISYRGNAFAYLMNNELYGHLTLADSTSYTNGYSTSLEGNTVHGNTMYRIFGSNQFLESNNGSSINRYFGNVTMDIPGVASVYFNNLSKSELNGNLTINRTGAGYTRLFPAGANITGNFSYTKNNAGGSEIGTSTIKSLIGGTVNMNVTQDGNSLFYIHRLQNLTNGGSINVQNVRGLNIQLDTMLLSSLNVSGYKGNVYSYFHDNHITANVNLQDDPSYVNGYNTSMQNNTINGSTLINVEGTNSFIEASAANLPNTFNGNVIFNANSSAPLYVSHLAKSTFNGDLTIYRYASGHTQAFNSGGNINGNLAYFKNTTGASYLGSTSQKTAITGKINLTVTQSLSDVFNMFWLVNNTNGGNINVQYMRGLDIEMDSIKVNDFLISGFGGNNYSYFSNNQIEGNLNLADDISYTNGYAFYIDNNTLMGNTVITNNGTNTFIDANSGNTGNTYLGTTTFIRNNGNINIGNADTSSFAGDLIFNSSTPINANLVKFDGSANTQINQLGSSPIAMNQLILDKSSFASVTLAKPVIVNSVASFLNGFINSSNANPLVFLNNATHNNSSDNSHVKGFVTKVGDDAFLFPLGNGIGLNPLAITAPSGVTDTFKAGLKVNNPAVDGYPTTSKEASLINMSTFNYWTLQRTAGSNPITVSLGWGTQCINAGITNLGALAVSRWNGSIWTNLGNSATSGSISSGMVTMAGTTTNFGPFALASTTNSNQWSTGVTTVTGTNSSICPGANTTLTASGGSSYTWMPGNLTGASVVVNPSTTTTYTVTGYTATGCPSTATKTILVNVLAPLSTTVSSSAVCTGASASITASGANTYSWQPGSLSGATVNVTPASTTIYTVTATYANGCTATSTRKVTVGNCATCASNVVISTSPYSILLTESQTYIRTSGTVLIESGSFVKFDAAATSYVLLDKGFNAANGSVFIAQALNGCTAGSPQLPSLESTSKESVSVVEKDESIIVYPNPTTGKITIEHPISLDEIALYDLTGKLVMKINTMGDTRSDIDIGQLSQGVYILYAKGFSSIKVIKN